MSLFHCLCYNKGSVQVRGTCIRFVTTPIFMVKSWHLAQSRSLRTSVCDCLFNIFAATLHIGGRSSIRNLRTHHAMKTETHVSWTYPYGKNLWNNLQLTLFMPKNMCSADQKRQVLHFKYLCNSSTVAMMMVVVVKVVTVILMQNNLFLFECHKIRTYIGKLIT